MRALRGEEIIRKPNLNVATEKQKENIRNGNGGTERRGSGDAGRKERHSGSGGAGESAVAVNGNATPIRRNGSSNSSTSPAKPLQANKPTINGPAKSVTNGPQQNGPPNFFSNFTVAEQSSDEEKDDELEEDEDSKHGQNRKNSRPTTEKR